MKKKILKLSYFFVLFFVGVVFLSSCSKNNNESKIRNGNNIEIEPNYFETLDEYNDDTLYKAVAKKKISRESLFNYETVSLSDEEDYLITYEVITNFEESTMTLNVYFDNSKEVIIENFIGIPMSNYNNEEDILFSIDDEHIFLSELNNLTEVEQCSWFGNALHKFLNGSMLALSYVEPAIKILVYTTDNVLVNLYSTVKNTSYKLNYVINSNKTQPTGYVYGQNYYSDWKFGFSYMDYAGCEVIAGYNVAKAKGRDITLADTIFLYESLGIEIGVAQGFFGSNPYQISYFLVSTDISYNKVFSYKTFEKYMNDNNDYYVILSRWNGEGKGDEIHTFIIDKTYNSDTKYKAYNFNTFTKNEVEKSAYDTNNYFDFFNGRINKTFICAYFISK